MVQAVSMRTPRPDHVCRPCVPLIIAYGGKSTSCKSCIMCLGKHRVHLARRPHSVHMRRGRDADSEAKDVTRDKASTGTGELMCAAAIARGAQGLRQRACIGRGKTLRLFLVRVRLRLGIVEFLSRAIQRSQRARERGGDGKVGVRGRVSGGENKDVQRGTWEGG